MTHHGETAAAPAESPIRVRILVEEGPDKGRTFVLRGTGNLTIGRGEEAQLRLNDTGISRAHARLGIEDGVCVLHDLDSANGTFVNGSRTRRVTLNPGDAIVVGDSILRVKDAPVLDDPRIGRELAGYRILHRIGRGAIGTVYEAKQLSLDRTVALKLLLDERKEEKFIDLFLQEARSAAKLTHVHVVQVYDAGAVDGDYFISMEFMRGGSVRDLLDQHGRLPPDRALSVVIETAKGLAFAERQGIVHRDIKPDNLMITEEQHTKIADLGIAKSREALRERDPEAGIFGSPHYLSPEQAQNHPVDNRADIYALGMTWYRMLAGRTPFQAKTLRELLLKQVREKPQPIRELVPEVGRSEATAIERMTEKDPEKRYATVQEVLDTLIGIATKRRKRGRGPRPPRGIGKGGIGTKGKIGIKGKGIRTGGIGRGKLGRGRRTLRRGR